MLVGQMILWSDIQSAWLQWCICETISKLFWSTYSRTTCYNVFYRINRYWHVWEFVSDCCVIYQYNFFSHLWHILSPGLADLSIKLLKKHLNDTPVINRWPMFSRMYTITGSRGKTFFTKQLGFSKEGIEQKMETWNWKK